MPNASEQRIAKGGRPAAGKGTGGSNGSGTGSTKSGSSTAKRGSGSTKSGTSRNGGSAGKRAGAAKPKASATGVSKNRSKKGKGRTAASQGKSRSAPPKGKAAAAAQAVKSKVAPSGGDNGDGSAALDTGKHLASALFKPTGKRHKKHPIARKVAKVTAKKVLGKLGKGSVNAGAGALRTVAEGAGTLGRQTMNGGLSRILERRPPIQASVDVAAPVHVVWSEWMTFEWFTEGLHRIEEVERDGDELVGSTAGPEGRDWRAEIVDEREHQAFAWRSEEGTDCAGLVTFHELSERLTRVEADLDVLPTNPAEAFLLTLKTPAKRAQRELQRFKAAVEFINPDSYEKDESGSEQEQPDDEQQQSDNDGDRREADE